MCSWGHIRWCSNPGCLSASTYTPVVSPRNGAESRPAISRQHDCIITQKQNVTGWPFNDFPWPKPYRPGAILAMRCTSYTSFTGLLFPYSSAQKALWCASVHSPPLRPFTLKDPRDFWTTGDSVFMLRLQPAYNVKVQKPALRPSDAPIIAGAIMFD